MWWLKHWWVIMMMLKIHRVKGKDAAWLKDKWRPIGGMWQSSLFLQLCCFISVYTVRLKIKGEQKMVSGPIKERLPSLSCSSRTDSQTDSCIVNACISIFSLMNAFSLSFSCPKLLFECFWSNLSPLLLFFDYKYFFASSFWDLI